MDTQTLGIALVIAWGIAIAVGLAALAIWYLVYLFLYAKRIFYYSLKPVDDSITLYFVWWLTAVVDTVLFVIAFATQTVTIFWNTVVTQLPLIIGLIIISFAAMGWTEYHDVVIRQCMGGYQCLFTWGLYDVRLMELVNIGRLFYNIGWPFVRSVARMTRFLLRTVPFVIFECAAPQIIDGLEAIGRFVLLFTFAFVEWVTSVDGITRGTIDVTEAYTVLTTGISDTLIGITVCICEQFDFVANIAFLWIKHPATVALLNDTTVLLSDAFLKIPLRTLTATNPGTVPGVTAVYGVFPNFDVLFDTLCEMTVHLAELANFQLFVVVSELVGQFDDSLFQPGSPEAIVLMYDWLGFLGALGCALIEGLRWAVHVITAGAFAVINLLTIEGGDVIVPAVPILCDLREMRALLDFGGLTGIYYKDGGIAGELQRALTSLSDLIDNGSTIARKLIVPWFRIIVDVIFGSLNFFWRFILHAIDSEFRTFSPSLPPRTGLPASEWVAPSPLPPPPLECSFITQTPGFVWVWVQHFVDDPEATILLVVDQHLTEVAEGLNELGTLADPALGDWLEQFILLPAYAIDFTAQTLVSLNIVFFEPPSNFALWVTRWRFNRFFQAFLDFGIDLAAALKLINPGPCVTPTDGFFCAFADTLGAFVAICEQVGNQIVYFFTTSRLEEVAMPNFILAINRFVASLEALMALISLLVPPLQLTATLDLQETFADLLITIPNALAFFLVVPNYAVITFQPVVDVIPGGNFTAIAIALEDYLIDGLNFTVQELFARICLLLQGIGLFIDRIGSTDLFVPIADALCAILQIIQIFVQEFVLKLISLLIGLIASIINVIFNINGMDFSVRIGEFFAAVGATITFIFTEMPLFLLEFFFGIIEAILPAPLNVIFGSVSRAIIDGLCSIIQFFIGAITDVLNFFGASLAPVDINCGTKKRFAETKDGKMVHDAIVSVMKNAYMDSTVFQHKMDRIRAVLGGGLKRSDGLIHANQTLADEAAALPPVTMSLDEALHAVVAFADWEGGSLCDQIVLAAAQLEHASDMRPMERAHFEDCVTKRALGEIVAVLPHMQWFPQDGFYNLMSWARLTMDGMRAYRIYTQYTQDHAMPPEVVLSVPYRETWEAYGMAVDHLTNANYYYMLNNMTLQDYFARNDGNYALAEGLLGLFQAGADGLLNYGVFLDNLTSTLDDTSTGAGSLSTFVGTLYTTPNATTNTTTTETISPKQQLVHYFWRGILTLAKKAGRITLEATKAAYTTSLWNKTKAAAIALPGLAVRAVTWTVSESSEEWLAAVEVRNDRLVAHGFMVLSDADRHAAGSSPIFGRLSMSALTTRLREWVRDTLYRALGHLKPNDPRARRNWRIILSAVNQVRQATQIGLPSQTVRTERLEARSHAVVAPLADTCNTSLVPICFECEVLDAGLAELGIAGAELADYWTTLFPDSVELFNETREYIQDNVTNVCGGTGFSVIRFPSDLAFTDDLTFFDVLGGPEGAWAGLLAFIESIFDDLTGTAAVTAAQGSTGFSYLRRALGTAILWPSADGTRGSSAAFSMAAANESLPNFVTIYAATHTEFDPTYAFTTVFSFESVLLFIDDLGEFINNVTIGPIDPPFLNDTDPGEPGTGPGSNATGVFGDLFNAVIAADFSYTCDERNMTLLQGIILFAFLGLLLLLVTIALDVTLPVSFTTALIVALSVAVLPYLFFMVVYGMPLQNLFFLPLPVPPPCFADDVVDLLVCDLLPKCPVVVAGLVDGLYTEANCRSCPFDLPILNCKRDIPVGVRHGFDVVVLCVQWWFPGFLADLQAIADSIPLLDMLMSVTGVDLLRYASVDLTDQAQFDVYISCLGVMSLAAPVGLLVGSLFLVLVGSLLIAFAFGLLANLFTILLVTYLLIERIGSLLTYNLIYVVPPGDRERFVQAIRSTITRVPLPTLRLGNPKQLLSRALTSVDETFGFSYIWRTRNGDAQLKNRKRRKKRKRK